MVLPPVVFSAILYRPTCLAVYLTANDLVLIKLFGTLALLNAVVLLAVTALVRGVNDADFAPTGLDALLEVQSILRLGISSLMRMQRKF